MTLRRERAARENHSLVGGLPNVCGYEADVIPGIGCRPLSVFRGVTDVNFSRIRSAFALALHMHQPTVPAGAGQIRTAPLIGYLQYMLDHLDQGDNHNAPIFAQCYTRIADSIRTLADAGCSPRIMLDYSGNLLWGLEQMGRADILDNLRSVTCDPRYHRYVEWLGTMWGHAVVGSTPVPDIRRHMVAWRHHYASIFGREALERVRGFSSPEMSLPNDPDMAYAYVDALLTCGYAWLLVQEHTVENLDGSGIRTPHRPHRLVTRNTAGDELSITALIKTQGSDAKLVAQMQPLSEARTLQRMELGGVSIPPLVTQIGDGENGGVMMNEFPAAYRQGFESLDRQDVAAMNGTEYLELVEAAGVSPNDFPPVRPRFQHRVWERYSGGGREAFGRVVEDLKKQDHRFHMEGGSWTNNISWVKGYENVLTPMQQLSARFHRVVEQRHPDPNTHDYRQALVLLLCSQTSCFRYWGQGIWTDYAIEICRRGREVLERHFGG
jgi:hypothetical protein